MVENGCMITRVSLTEIESYFPFDRQRNYLEYWVKKKLRTCMPFL